MKKRVLIFLPIMFLLLSTSVYAREAESGGGGSSGRGGNDGEVRGPEVEARGRVAEGETEVRGQETELRGREAEGEVEIRGQEPEARGREAEGETEIRGQEFEIRGRGQVEDDFQRQIETEFENPELQRLEFRNNNGQFEVQFEDTGGQSRVFDDNSIRQLRFGLPEDQNRERVEVEARDTMIRFASRGVEAETRFPVSFDRVARQLFVSTPQGMRAIRVLPNQAAEIARNRGLVTKIERIELQGNEGQSGGNDDIAFEISGQKSGKLLGLFPTKSSVKAKIGAESGEVLQVKLTRENLLMDLLSAFIR